MRWSKFSDLQLHVAHAISSRKAKARRGKRRDLNTKESRRIVEAMALVLRYDEEAFVTGVTVIDEDYATAKELLREKAGWL